MAEFDIVIRGGTLFDGSGNPPVVGDLAVVGKKIAAIGQFSGSGAEEIDAKGQIVTPGFVDTHTHLDGHVTWESRLHPLTGHGVTTALTGNCGVGFAPCRPEDRDMLVGLMEAVEDISVADLNAGLPWNWETFPDYLDALDKREFNVDVATLLPHSTLRAYVMGARGLSEPATSSDRDRMREATAEAIEAGALGVGTTRLRDQKTGSGDPIPTIFADEAEYEAIALGMRDAGGGILQVAIEFNRFPLACEELEMFAAIGQRTGQPVMYSCKQTNASPDGWRDLLAISDRVNAAGVAMYPQVLGRPTGAILGLQTSMHPFSRSASYAPIAKLSLKEKVEALSDPSLREKLVSEVRQGQERLPERLRGFRLIFPLNDPPNYEPQEDESIEALATRLGQSSIDLMYDLLIAEGGTNMFLLAGGNYAQFSLDPALEMLRNPHSILGLGDAGAHAGIICDASVTTYMLSYWTRDRTRGAKLPIPEVVRWLTHDSAKALGLNDRGLLKVGLKADINVIDYDRLRLRRPRATHDLPAGGTRLVQDAEGYTATIVSGSIVHRNDRPTDALTGRLTRGQGFA
jgi:N-acyl-D-amino-acid deacylase